MRYATELLTDRPPQIGKLKLPYLRGAPSLMGKVIGFYPMTLPISIGRDRGGIAHGGRASMGYTPSIPPIFKTMV